MLHLKANPLLREPLKLTDLKPRLLGHWGSDAGQSFTYTHRQAGPPDQGGDGILN
jgi:xylulose-5-phosphate/fructose-6-phosphate phosphoketolase